MAGLYKARAADFRELQADESAALQAFADAHGRRWRDELANVYWYNARVWHGPVPGMGNVLHAIRNEFGPSWLYDVCKVRPAPKARP